MTEAARPVDLLLRRRGRRRDRPGQDHLYVVGWDPSQFEALVTGLMAAQVDHPFPDAPLTLIGVQTFFDPAHLIEIEAVAVVGG